MICPVGPVEHMPGSVNGCLRIQVRRASSTIGMPSPDNERARLELKQIATRIRCFTTTWWALLRQKMLAYWLSQRIPTGCSLLRSPMMAGDPQNILQPESSSASVALRCQMGQKFASSIA